MNLFRVRFAGQVGMLNLANSVRMSVWLSMDNASKFSPAWADLEIGVLGYETVHVVLNLWFLSKVVRESQLARVSHVSDSSHIFMTQLT